MVGSRKICYTQAMTYIYANKYVKVLLLAALSFGLISMPATAASNKTDKEIVQILIRESIASYRGSCPCPYSIMRNGRRCGKFSAYSKPGGEEPLCYDTDVTAKMIARYRNR